MWRAKKIYVFSTIIHAFRDALNNLRNYRPATDGSGDNSSVQSRRSIGPYISPRARAADRHTCNIAKWRTAPVDVVHPLLRPMHARRTKAVQDREHVPVPDSRCTYVTL
jgi:hypothetical protein